MLELVIVVISPVVTKSQAMKFANEVRDKYPILPISIRVLEIETQSFIQNPNYDALLKELALRVDTEAASKLYPEVIVLEDANYSSEVDILRKFLEFYEADTCTGKDIKPIVVSIGEQRTISVPNLVQKNLFFDALSGMYKISQDNRSYLQQGYDKLWTLTADATRAMAQVLGVKSRITLVRFDKSCHTSELLPLRKRFTSANVVSAGRDFSSDECSPLDNWDDKLISDIKDVTQEKGIVQITMPRSFPYSLEMFDTFYDTITALTLHGFTVSFAAEQSLTSFRLMHLFKNNPMVQNINLHGATLQEAVDNSHELILHHRDVMDNSNAFECERFTTNADDKWACLEHERNIAKKNMEHKELTFGSRQPSSIHIMQSIAMLTIMYLMFQKLKACRKSIRRTKKKRYR